MTHKQAVAKLDKVFSEYIRRRKADYNGVAICVTCGAAGEWKKMQAGHFYSRAKYGTRWDDRNVHVQCMRCNVFLKGNYIPYVQYMQRRYTEQEMEQLEMRANSSPKFKVPELELMIAEVQKRLALLTN